MVKDTGKTLRAGAYRPVNLPGPVKVKEDADGLPQALEGKRLQSVSAIEDTWRLDDEWWRREPLARLYYTVRLTSGQRLVLYKDLNNGGWYRQSY
jgi:hypothetical protein